MHSSSSVCVNEENSDTIFSASFMSSGLGSSSEKGGKIGKQLPQTFDRWESWKHGIALRPNSQPYCTQSYTCRVVIFCCRFTKTGQNWTPANISKFLICIYSCFVMLHNHHMCLCQMSPYSKIHSCIIWFSTRISSSIYQEYEKERLFLSM